MRIQRLHTDNRMSQIVIHRDTVYLAGQVGEDMAAGIEQQTLETLQEIEKLLAQAGSDKQHILSVTIYLKDIARDFAGMNAVWDRWLPEGVAPARATVEAGMCESEILVEMSVVAALPEITRPDNL
ncbi:RidA family protein [Halopseudomonas bauzanensis]|uniref:RidA family protein n=1 Tax=Halopseudomonas bauzanensis TaxID=653930 RepID=UPI00255359E4|nr:RidA family protein [Halopseudomonas bauzanensis]